MDGPAILTTLAGILALIGVAVSPVFFALTKAQEKKDQAYEVALKTQAESHAVILKILMESSQKLQEQNEDLRSLLTRTTGVAEGMGQVLTTRRPRS